MISRNTYINVFPGTVHDNIYFNCSFFANMRYYSFLKHFLKWYIRIFTAILICVSMTTKKAHSFTYIC